MEILRRSIKQINLLLKKKFEIKKLWKKIVLN